MGEDLAISKNTILSLQDENHQLRLRLEQYTAASTPDSSSINIAQLEPLPKKILNDKSGLLDESTNNSSAGGISERKENNSSSSTTSPIPANLSVTDLSKKLHDERTKRSDLEKEIETHVSCLSNLKS